MRNEIRKLGTQVRPENNYRYPSAFCFYTRVLFGSESKVRVYFYLATGIGPIIRNLESCVAKQKCTQCVSPKWKVHMKVR